MEIKKIFLAIALLSSVVAVNAMENTHNGVSYKLTRYNKAEYEMLKKRLNSAQSQAKAKAQEDLNNFFKNLVGSISARGQDALIQSARQAERVGAERAEQQQDYDNALSVMSFHQAEYQYALREQEKNSKAQITPVVHEQLIGQEEDQAARQAVLALASRPVEHNQSMPEQVRIELQGAPQKRRAVQVGSFGAPMGLALGGYLLPQVQDASFQIALGAGVVAVGGMLRSQCDTNRVKTRRALTTVAAVAGAAGFVSTVGNFVLGLVGDSTPARAAITLSTSVVASLYAAKKLVDHYDSQVTPVVVLAQEPFEVVDAAEAAEATDTIE